jgi:hypothetical protein
MDNRFNLGIAGSLTLFLGVFAPIVHVPIVGSQNFFQNGRGDGVIILLLAFISLLLTVRRRFRGLLATGLITLALLAFTFLNFQSRLAQVRAEMEAKLAGNPFRGFGDAMLGSVQLQWGWGVLIVGAVLLVLAGAGGREEADDSTSAQ